MSWQQNIIEDAQGIRELLARTRRIAVLGMKSERHTGQPAFYVPQYMVSAGLEVIPVPVYELELKEILGQKVYHTLTDIPGEIDLVDVFRRPNDINKHIDDILTKKPAAVWFQSGIVNNEAAETFARAGIKVVQDRCLMVEYMRLRRSP